MHRILRISAQFFYEKMEKRDNRGNKNGSVSWALLPWMLLALFSNYVGSRADEPRLDEFVCGNNFWRKNVEERNMDLKVFWNCPNNVRTVYQSRTDCPFLVARCLCIVVKDCRLDASSLQFGFRIKNTRMEF